MNTTVRYIILTALRDWLFAGIIFAIIAAIFFSNFLGSTVMIEQNEMKAAFISATTRIVLIVGMIVFICFNVRRSFENKEIDLMLSRPISRGEFIFSYWFGFSAIGVIIISIIAVYIGFFIKGFNTTGFSYWVFSLIFEMLIVVAFAIFSSVILVSSVSSVLLCFGFYIVSRMVGFFNFVLEKSGGDYTSLDWYSRKVIWVASYLMPRLDLFSKSDWLIYGIDFSSSQHLIPIIQSIIYIPLLLSFAAIDFKRKQF